MLKRPRSCSATEPHHRPCTRAWQAAACRLGASTPRFLAWPLPHGHSRPPPPLWPQPVQPSLHHGLRDEKRPWRANLVKDFFGRVQIVLVGYKSFWSGPNHFCQVQIRLFWTDFYNLDLSKMIWTQRKQIGLVQNNWYWNKISV